MPRTAYLPDYDHDIFVSYVREEELGEWTMRLRDELRRALNLILHAKPPDPIVNVWIDEELRKYSPLSDELKERVEKSAFLLIVMSPLYLSSEWCGKEVQWFSAAAGSQIAADGRVFVVHAFPTDRAKWPDPIAKLPGYRFFARDPDVGIDLPVGLIGNDQDKIAFKKALYNLAGQIKSRIDDLISASSSTSAPPASVIPITAARPPLMPAPPKLVCLDVLGSSSEGGRTEQELRRILKARNVDIFAPSSLGAIPQDPAGAERYLQRLTKARAGCDGLIVLRTDQSLPLADWLLDYVSEIRPVARRLRGSVPPPLVIDLGQVEAAAAVEVESVRYGEAGFEEFLANWLDRLPIARQEAA